MSKIIYKFPLELTGLQTVSMPEGAKILSIQFQGVERACIWALVNPDLAKVDREIKIYWTGENIPDSDELLYITTAQSGPTVWHFFERTKTEGKEA